jgi:DNA polymerase elongation subunit (family B)
MASSNRFDGELVVRGIEIRRHDVPAFIKRFQTQLLHTLFDCKDSSEILTKGYEDALLIVTQAIDTIMTGEGLNDQDLVISKLLRQDIQRYKSLFPHVSAAIQSRNYPLKGDTIQYIYTDSKHNNPLRRVTPIENLVINHHFHSNSQPEKRFDYDTYGCCFLSKSSRLIRF